VYNMLVLGSPWSTAGIDMRIAVTVRSATTSTSNVTEVCLFRAPDIAQPLVPCSTVPIDPATGLSSHTIDVDLDAVTTSVPGIYAIRVYGDMGLQIQPTQSSYTILVSRQ
jgi:hypothetical protein